MSIKEEMRFKILMCFLQFSEENRKITKMAQSLGMEKYEMSRQVALLAKEELIDRSDVRNPMLTPKGRLLAEKYANRMKLAQNHLTFEGVAKEEIMKDALMLTLYCSDSFFETLQLLEETMRMKQFFAERKTFSGSEFCEQIKDGNYTFPFIIYREKVKGHNNISMANDGFVHPCEVIIRENGGVILLKAIEMNENSKFNGVKMRGMVQHLKYYDGKEFVEAVVSGGFIQIPLNCFHFVNIGSDTMTRVLHGSICLKMRCSVGEIHMPESTAIFTVLIH